MRKQNYTVEQKIEMVFESRMNKKLRLRTNDLNRNCKIIINKLRKLKVEDEQIADMLSDFFHVNKSYLKFMYNL